MTVSFLRVYRQKRSAGIDLLLQKAKSATANLSKMKEGLEAASDYSYSIAGVRLAKAALPTLSIRRTQTSDKGFSGFGKPRPIKLMPKPLLPGCCPI
jgi:hypothetical protein